MQTYEKIRDQLVQQPRTWLVTGCAGFIGSNLLETLLKLGQDVVGLDNFSTGYLQNLKEVKPLVDPGQWAQFQFIEGDIRDLETCRRACRGVDYVLHQAAIGSVPRSVDDPVFSHENNLSGTLNMLIAAREARVRNMVYASSSAVYGDDPDLPKVESTTGKCLSPYAVTKLSDELYAQVFADVYGFGGIGLRYFNVFGPRQDPNGAYAAVIPQWFAAMIRGEPVYINGDGRTSRDFCYIDNCVQANILAAYTDNQQALNRVYNVACGERTTLNELFRLVRDQVAGFHPEAGDLLPTYRDFRPGDVRHSLADITRAHDLLGYEPRYSVREGLGKAGKWYVENVIGAGTAATRVA